MTARFSSAIVRSLLRCRQVTCEARRSTYRETGGGGSYEGPSKTTVKMLDKEFHLDGILINGFNTEGFRLSNTVFVVGKSFCFKHFTTNNLILILN